MSNCPMTFKRMILDQKLKKAEVHVFKLNLGLKGKK